MTWKVLNGFRQTRGITLINLTRSRKNDTSNPQFGSKICNLMLFLFVIAALISVISVYALLLFKAILIYHSPKYHMVKTKRSFYLTFPVYKYTNGVHIVSVRICSHWFTQRSENCARQPGTENWVYCIAPKPYCDCNSALCCCRLSFY